MQPSTPSSYSEQKDTPLPLGLMTNGKDLDTDLVSKYVRSELTPAVDTEVRENIRQYRNWLNEYMRQSDEYKKEKGARDAA